MEDGTGKAESVAGLKIQAKCKCTPLQQCFDKMQNQPQGRKILFSPSCVINQKLIRIGAVFERPICSAGKACALEMFFHTSGKRSEEGIVRRNGECSEGKKINNTDAGRQLTPEE